MEANFLESTKALFRYYRQLGEKALQQISEADINWQFNPESNSIAVLVKHLWGNMRSRFTDFLSSDGEKPWRRREAEFDNDIRNLDELWAKWNEGWDCLFQALESLSEEDLGRTVYIRNQGHTVVEALQRQLTHYAYHIGQLVYLARMRRGAEWQSLSIPRGKTEEFNRQMFAREKHPEHFTRSYLDDPNPTPEDPSRG